LSPLSSSAGEGSGVGRGVENTLSV
jgi:hypothetical protein